MKKILSSIFVVSLVSGFMLSPAMASTKVVGEVTFSQLGAEEPAILVGNPFYSLQKKFRLGLKRLFTSDSQDINLKRQSLNDTAAGVKKIFDLQSKNEEILLAALAEYQQEVTVYRSALTSLVKDKRSLVDASGALSQALTHLRLTDDLSSSYFSSEVMAILLDIQDQLADVVDVLFVDMLGSKSGREAIDDWASSEELIEQIRSWETLDLLASRLDEESRLGLALYYYNSEKEQSISEAIDLLGGGELETFISNLENLAGSHRFSESR